MDKLSLFTNNSYLPIVVYLRSILQMRNWGSEWPVQRPQGKGKIWVWTSTALSVLWRARAGSGGHHSKWLLGTHGGTRGSIHSPQQCRGSRSNDIPRLHQEMNMSRHIHACASLPCSLTGSSPFMCQGKISHPQTLQFFCKLTYQERKKNRRKKN